MEYFGIKKTRLEYYIQFSEINSLLISFDIKIILAY